MLVNPLIHTADAALVMAAERLYSWQDNDDKPFWEGLARAAGESRYVYLNTGGLMGTALALTALLNASAAVE